MVISTARFADTLDRVHQLQARELANPLLNPNCHSVLLHHGRPTQRAVVFLHGISSSPLQFHELAPLFHARGYNVLIPRMPRHGYRDRLSPDHGRLTSQEYVSYASEAAQIGRGLGEHLTVAGLSVSGVVAAWCAQYLTEVDLAVLIAPAFAPSDVPLSLVPALTQVVLKLPNIFVWWDFRKRERLGPECGYPRFSTHAMAQCFRLAASISAATRRTPPAARTILVITNVRDPAVNNAATSQMLKRWRAHGTASVCEYQFGPELGRFHDIIGPYQPYARVDFVYPVLLAEFDRATQCQPHLVTDMP